MELIKIDGLTPGREISYCRFLWEKIRLSYLQVQEGTLLVFLMWMSFLKSGFVPYLGDNLPQLWYSFLRCRDFLSCWFPYADVGEEILILFLQSPAGRGKNNSIPLEPCWEMQDHGSMGISRDDSNSLCAGFFLRWSSFLKYEVDAGFLRWRSFLDCGSDFLILETNVLTLKKFQLQPTVMWIFGSIYRENVAFYFLPSQ